MSKDVLISIRPEWVKMIANDLKTIEVRKTRPKLEIPFKCYIYCTNARPRLAWADVFRGDWCTEVAEIRGYNREDAERTFDIFNGRVIGEFVCDRIIPIRYDAAQLRYHDVSRLLKEACMTEDALEWYLKCKDGYGWQISKLGIYDTPKKLDEFMGLCKHTWDCCACPYYNYEKMECDGRKIKRPPQSWCYVEEVSE